jgi:hypothetical protein
MRCRSREGRGRWVERGEDGVGTMGLRRGSEVRMAGVDAWTMAVTGRA